MCLILSNGQGKKTVKQVVGRREADGRMLVFVHIVASTELESVKEVFAALMSAGWRTDNPNEKENRK